MRKLRIFYASDTTPNAWFHFVRSNIWRNNLLLPLQDLGHDVIEFNHDLTQTFRNLDPSNPKQAAFIEKNRPLITEALLTQLTAAHAQKPIDLLFTYYTDACITPDALDHIRSLGIKTVNWYCNGSYLLHLVKDISPHYDFCLVPEKFRLPDYIAMGANPLYCQEAANPNIYKPIDIKQDFDVTFVGQAYGERPLLINHLLHHGIRVHTFGHGWSNPDPRYIPAETHASITAIPQSLRSDPLSDDDLVTMYSRSKINLGFSTCGNTHLDPQKTLQVRLRDFEVPMSGGFYLVETVPELAEFFDLKNEIVTYNNPNDLINKIRHYLAFPQEREKIRAAGLARARKDHSWQKRFTHAFQQMGLS